MPVAPRYFMGRWLYAKYDMCVCVWVCILYGDKNWAYFSGQPELNRDLTFCIITIFDWINNKNLNSNSNKFFFVYMEDYKEIKTRI